MNIKFLTITILAMPLMLLLPGCGARQKSVLLKLSTGMSKAAVKSKIGKPDEIDTPITDKKGNVTDVWRYSIVSYDRNQQTKQLVYIPQEAPSGYGKISKVNGLPRTKLISGYWRGGKYVEPYYRSK